MKNHELNKQNTWYKIVPSVNLQRSQGHEQIFENLEMVKSDKINMKIKEAIHQIDENNDAEDKQLEIDLEFLMSDQSESSGEEQIAEKVVTEV